MLSTISHLECSLTGERLPAGQPHNLSAAGAPLLVKYDLERARAEWRREDVAKGPNSMWRYSPVLPATREESIVSLGEGMTPLKKLVRFALRIGAADLWFKHDGLNPTFSFKARGLACAGTMGK